MKISPVMQDYLAAIYHLADYQGEGSFVSASALAQVMNVSAPAVTRMVQRLKDGGYLEHQPYQGIALTSAGTREALANIRRHRLVERFLVDVMGFDWHETHDMAAEFEPLVADVVIRRMETMLGNPGRCPHGEPIPSEDGSIPQVKDFSVLDAEVGREYVLSRANTHDVEKLKYLGNMGLKPGATLYFSERAPFDGPLQLRVNDQSHFIGHALAGILRVCSQEAFDAI